MLAWREYGIFRSGLSNCTVPVFFDSVPAGNIWFRSARFTTGPLTGNGSVGSLPADGPEHFAQPQPGRVRGQEHGAVFQVRRVGDQPLDLLTAQEGWQRRASRLRREACHAAVSFNSLYVDRARNMAYGPTVALAMRDSSAIERALQEAPSLVAVGSSPVGATTSVWKLGVS